MRGVKHIISAFFLVLGASAAAWAQTDAPAKNDYGDAKNWLCRPGAQDACAIDLTTSIVAADGKLTREEWKANPEAPIDCFYAYPTVSRDTTPNSDMAVGPEERLIVASQLARFASVCRVYTPMYRQITLVGLRSGLLTRAGGSPERTLAYNDVKDAWNHYLQNDSKGRGVVLLAHSQGSFLLADLIANEIDNKPAVQPRLISAVLLGMNLPVPKGKDVGGAFKSVPLCRTAGQTGCVISYASFRSTVPPPADALFGRVPGENMEAACTNPAALKGGSADVHAYLRNSGTPFSGTGAPAPWSTGGTPVETPFVSVPGLISAACVSNDKGSYLEVTVKGNPADPRVDDIAGDVMAAGKPNPSWGLHLIDVNLTIGNLLDVVRAQTKTHLAKAGKPAR